jgi:hypothetical protein
MASKTAIEPTLNDAMMRFALLDETMLPKSELSSSRWVIRLGALARVLSRCLCNFSPGSFFEPGRFT